MLIVNINKFDKQRLNLLVGRIKNTKHLVELDMSYGRDPINFEKAYTGRRYSDDERIAYMVCGDIVKTTDNFTLGSKINYEDSNKKFLSLNSSDMDVFIKKAVIESARADYYYDFEKEW